MIDATKKWIFLKVSSVVLVPLMLWFVVNLVSIYDKDYDQIIYFFTSQPSKFLFSFFIIVAFFYSALSISEIFEDYLHNEKIKNVANRFLFISAIIIPILTIITFICFWAALLLLGDTNYELIQNFFETFFGKFIIIGTVWSFSFQILSEIRHLFWDLGFGFELKTSNITGLIVIFGSFVLTILIFVLGKGLVL